MNGYIVREWLSISIILAPEYRWADILVVRGTIGLRNSWSTLWPLFPNFGIFQSQVKQPPSPLPPPHEMTTSASKSDYQLWLGGGGKFGKRDIIQFQCEVNQED